ncbi:MAG: DUF1003 domain-containing protein [Jiangellales bacterium]
MPERDRLDLPGAPRRAARPSVDPDAFGQASEGIARFIGTGRFLVYMTVFILGWLVWNSLSSGAAQFDPFPFIFLTLVLSVQASYAAPLILLAQNRQDDRDRVSLEQDRQVAAQSRADMEFLAREIAALRLAVGEMATRDFIRSELREMSEDIVEELEEFGDEAEASDGVR